MGKEVVSVRLSTDDQERLEAIRQALDALYPFAAPHSTTDALLHALRRDHEYILKLQQDRSRKR